MLIRSALRYRMPLIALAWLLSLLPFQYSSVGFGHYPQYAAICIAMLAASLILTNKASDTIEDALNPRSLALNPAKKRATTIVGAIFFLLPIPWMALTSLHFLGAYLGLGALGYLYNYGIAGIRLKNILLVKNLTVAGWWALATSTPYYFFAPDFDLRFFLMSIISNALIMLAMDIFADIRDIKGDREAGIRTLANTLGIIPAQILSLLCIVGYAVYTASWYKIELAQMLAYSVFAALIVMAAPKRHYALFQSMTFLWIIMTVVTLLKKILMY